MDCDIIVSVKILISVFGKHSDIMSSLRADRKNDTKFYGEVLLQARVSTFQGFVGRHIPIAHWS